MVAAATTRARPASPGLPVSPTFNKPRRPIGTYLLIGIPALLLVTFAWQIASMALHTEVAVRQATSVGQVTLEPDPAGSRVDFVLVDRVGQETTFSGDVVLKLREPDGTYWQTRRTVSATDFQPLPDGSYLAGRSGLSIVIPAGDWARAPRRGGSTSVSIEVAPDDGTTAFSTVSAQRFP
jgi:hypothetical protein